MTRWPELALGTAQFGMAYGLSGRGGAVPSKEIRQIIDAASRLGIHVLDTAPGYGNIEARLADHLGRREFHIVSKIPALPPGADAGTAADFVTQSIRTSRSRLGPAVGTMLFHRGEDLLGPNADAAWQAARVASECDGFRLGVSCYAPGDAVAIARRWPIEVAQFPGNAFDQRFLQDRHAEDLQSVEIHVRSVFLQGLLLMPRETAGSKVPQSVGLLDAWSEWCSARGLTALRAALGIAKSLPGVRYCVVGVDRQSQLEEIAEAWQGTSALAAPSLATLEPDVIDPRRWER